VMRGEEERQRGGAMREKWRRVDRRAPLVFWEPLREYDSKEQAKRGGDLFQGQAVQFRLALGSQMGKLRAYRFRNMSWKLLAN
jgi:hypothetical protein